MLLPRRGAVSPPQEPPILLWSEKRNDKIIRWANRDVKSLLAIPAGRYRQQGFIGTEPVQSFMRRAEKYVPVMYRNFRKKEDTV